MEEQKLTFWYQAAEGNMKNTSDVGYPQLSLFTSYHKGGPQGQVSYLGLWKEQDVGEMYSLTVRKPEEKRTTLKM